MILSTEKTGTGKVLIVKVQKNREKEIQNL